MGAISSWMVLATILVCGGLAVGATAYYPIVRANEDKAQLANDAKALIGPEITLNIATIFDMHDRLQNKQVNSKRPEVSAWETTARGGLLIGLDPSEVRKYLAFYSLIYRVNNRIDRFEETFFGSQAALNNIQDVRNLILRDISDGVDGLVVAAKTF